MVTSGAIHYVLSLINFPVHVTFRIMIRSKLVLGSRYLCVSGTHLQRFNSYCNILLNQGIVVHRSRFVRCLLYRYCTWLHKQVGCWFIRQRRNRHFCATGKSSYPEFAFAGTLDIRTSWVLLI